jgi:hypothetical protein
MEMIQTNNTNSQSDYMAARNEQLKQYRDDQNKIIALAARPDVSTKVNVNNLIVKAKQLLNEITALNISNLNLPVGTTISSQINNSIDAKTTELFILLKDIKDVHKFSGKIWS